MAAKEKVCSVEGCGKPHMAKDLCNAHYKRQWKTGDTHENIPIRSQDRQVGICNVDGCDKLKHAKGLCKPHWKRQWRTGDIQEEKPIQERQVGICNVDGCDRLKRTKGLCEAHYERKRRYGDVRSSVPVRAMVTMLSKTEYGEMKSECQELSSIGKKRCYRCKKIKELSEFYPSYRLIENASSWCKSCSLDNGRVRKYGIEPGEFDEIVKKQGYRCALCQKPLDIKKSRRAHVDHNHQTGEMRGVLCPFCNSSLGLFEDRGLTPQFVQDYIDQKGGGGEGNGKEEQAEAEKAQEVPTL